MLIHSGDMLIVQTIDGDAVISATIDGETSNFMPVETTEVYTGETEVTPTDETQTLYTAGLKVPENIIVKPIPSNYGKVSYNGSFIFIE